MEMTSTVASFIRARFAAVGKSVEVIAHKAGFESSDTVVQIKNGDLPLPFDKIGKIAKVLQTDPFKLCIFSKRKKNGKY